ncbi:Clp amino terminal domain-containing protein, pathogenicity island component [Nakamurella panacisegetis]|uniref:Clp amino terminal domain-containing protein, pathogenicity island component n=1 Tax=Nakamurella panacisegetis TaxID=1090615 RepID=A0A1H0QYM9_9ACTN|nr:Clp protease N-terminal domain-containing protein [Nakamurella panacisegetis]SDP22354.1 Clp amino terminal domain-containing protein, pathogenicity island component [Nakamurella panacisegetis]
MFERFAQEARVAVTHAQQEARALRDSRIGTEHVLIGLAGDGGDAAAVALREAGITAASLRARLRREKADELDSAALASLGIDLEEVRRAAEIRFGVGALDPAPKGPRPKGHLPLSSAARKSLELAVRAAGHDRGPSAGRAGSSISSGHLLIGMLDAGTGEAARILRELDVDVVALRAAVLARLAQDAA